MGRPVRWARAMPSPVARSGRGLTALTFDRDFPAAARREVRSFFARVGQVFEIPESKFDAFTVTYSSSHGYHALAALAGAAEKLGLDRKTAHDRRRSCPGRRNSGLARIQYFAGRRYCMKLPRPAASPPPLWPAWINRDTNTPWKKD